MKPHEFYPDAEEWEAEYIDEFFEGQEIDNPAAVLSLEDYRRYQSFCAEKAGEEGGRLPDYFYKIEPYLKEAWLIQQKEIIRLRGKILLLESGQEELNL